VTKLPVTVVIPTKNEERNLPLCMERLGDFAEIWVVDSGSDDATVRIAEENGARVLQFDWQGGFPKKRNWVLMNETFNTPWVLFLDGDEHIPPEFVTELRGALADATVDGFWLNYTTHFMGRILKRGVPQRKLALFRVGAGLYERIEDPGWSRLDMEVHEHPQLSGPVGEISARIDHRDFRGIEHFIARHNAYSSWEAFRHAQLLADGEAAWEKLTPRQKTKYRSLDRWWFAPLYFLGTYIAKGGIWDGAAGLHYALLKFHYFHSIKLKIDERRRALDERVLR
jgi:glycosyltransferase involved in cell wall biosynthesis